MSRLTLWPRQPGLDGPQLYSLLHYQLPARTADARLLLRRSTDGRSVEQVVLDAATTQQELNLRGYEPGVYFATLLVGSTAVQTIRILVK